MNLNLTLVFFKVNEFEFSFFAVNEFEFRNSKQNEWIQLVPSLRGGGGGGGGAKGSVPFKGRLCSHFGLLKILLLKHHVTTRQQTMMEKGIITFKHNYLSMLFRFFAKLQAPTAVHLSEAIFRLIDTPLRMCRGRDIHVSMQNCYRYFVSDYDMKQCEKTFFQRPTVLIFRVHSTF